MITMYDIETDVDAYLRGYINGTLEVHKRTAPPKSDVRHYFTISDEFGLIDVFYCETAITQTIMSIREYAETSYNFKSRASDQVQYVL